MADERKKVQKWNPFVGKIPEIDPPTRWDEIVAVVFGFVYALESHPFIIPYIEDEHEWYLWQMGFNCYKGCILPYAIKEYLHLTEARFIAHERVFSASGELCPNLKWVLIHRVTEDT